MAQGRVDFGQQAGHIRRALVRVLGCGLLQHDIQRGWDSRVAFAQPGQGLVEVLQDVIDGGRARKGLGAAEQFIDQNPQAVNIGLGAHGLRADLFWRNVGRGT